MKFFRFVPLFAFLLFILVTPLSAKEDDAYIAGKVYDTDKKTPLEDVQVRVVSVETGKAKDTETKKEGCYNFKDVKSGMYSFSVNYKGQDYLLPQKVNVELLNREVAVAVCVALTDKNTLELLDDCHVCLGKGFPPLGILLIAGTSAVGAIAPNIGGGGEPIVSPSTP